MLNSAGTEVGLNGSRRELTIVIPAYNEQKQIRNTLEAVVRAADRHLHAYEVIVVNDGSADDTGRIADEFAAGNDRVRVVHQQTNRGLGAAYLLGLEQAKFPFISIVPGDNAYSQAALDSVFGAVNVAPLVVSYRANFEVRSPIRRVLSIICTTMMRIISGVSIRDAQSMFVFPVDLARRWRPEAQGYGYHIESIGRLLVMCPQVHQVPAILNPAPDESSGVMRPKVVFSLGMTMLRLGLWRLTTRRPKQASAGPASATPLASQPAGGSSTGAADPAQAPSPASSRSGVVMLVIAVLVAVASYTFLLPGYLNPAPKSGSGSKSPAPADQPAKVAVLAPTEIGELPRLPANARWDLIWALHAISLEQQKPVVVGQPVLRLVAVPGQERHALAARFGGLVQGNVYRTVTWVRSRLGVNAMLQVRDSAEPKTGRPPNEGEVRFDLAAGKVLMSNGNLVAFGEREAADGWRRLWVDIKSHDGNVFIYLGLLDPGSNSHTFKANGQELEFGGFEVVAPD